MKPITGKILENKYEILQEIKKGGFGIVYYGVDRNLNKPVAIKEIAPNLLDDPKYLDMFQEEALNIAKLSHNNIVHIYELRKTSNGHLFIVMEYIDGIDLEKIIRKARKARIAIPPALAVFIMAEVCMALDYAHQRRDAFTNKPLNLVHQDVSPSNVMISRQGDVKLIDFGIASVRRHRKSQKDTKLRGKIPYMAPEQLLMGNHPDHRSDLFSLGLVFYEALTAERLFNSQDEIIAAGKNPKMLKKMIRSKKLPSELSKIIQNALEVDLNKRYQNANHMYIDLLQYLISSNETGELMDKLGEFVSNNFMDDKTPLTSPNGFYRLPTDRATDASGTQPQPSSEPFSDDWSRPLSQQSNTPGPAEPQGHSFVTQDLFPLEDDNHQDPAAQPYQPLFTAEVEGEDDNLKTVIDVVRVTARNSKKHLWRGLLVLMVGLLGFGVLDVMNGWTRAGLWVYDSLFPPAIEIVTVPANASVHIDDTPVEGRTPVAIEEISPGVHKLELSLEGYKPIVKSLFVPRDGDIKIQGEATNGDDNKTSYLFRFSTDIEIKSNPPAAQVYINGTRLNQKTPCTLSWEVGNPLSIELEKAGFDRLTGYSLNTAQGFDEVDDRRFWELTVIDDTTTQYVVEGTFRKRVAVETVPPGVEIVNSQTDATLGIATTGSSIYLPTGRHVLEFRKQNYLPKTVTVTIDETFDETLNVILSRSVRFTAVDELRSGNQDIGANLISLQNGGNEYLASPKATPVQLSLPALTYRATFTRDGYQRKEVTIASDARSVRVVMTPARAVIEIVVLDALSNSPVADAQIYYNLLNSNQLQDSDSLLSRTNALGQSTRQLAAGNYVFRVQKQGYGNQERSIALTPGNDHRLEFKIYPTN